MKTRLPALLLCLAVLLSGCAGRDGAAAVTVSIRGKEYRLNVPEGTELSFSDDLLKVTSRETGDVMLDLSGLEGCKDIGRIYILSLGTADIVLPEAPGLYSVEIACENIDHLDCASAGGETSLLISGNLGALTARFPVDVAFEGKTDLGTIQTAAIFKRLALDRVCDLSPLASLDVRRLVLDGEGWDLGALSGNGTVTDLIIHGCAAPDLSFLPQTKITYLDAGICDDISALKGTGLEALVVRDDRLGDLSPIADMPDLKSLLILVPQGTPRSAWEISARNVDEIGGLGLSLDKDVLTDFVNAGGVISIMELLSGM